MNVESQAPYLSSPARLKRPHAAALETPKKSTPGHSPLARIVTTEKPQDHTVRGETVVHREESVRAIDYNARKKRKLAPNPGPVLGDGRQKTPLDTPKKPENVNVKSENFVRMEATVTNIPAKLQTETRKSSPITAPMPATESQDSLAGKVIGVAGRARSPNPKPTTSSIDQSASSSSSCGTKPDPKTPCINVSIHVPHASSSETSSSMRSTRSAVRETFHHLNTQDDGLRVLFSSATTIRNSKVFKRFLMEQGVKIVQDIKDATCFCVGMGELKRTTKLILVVLKGIHVIRDTWVTESARLKQLQDISLHTVKDSRREQEWGMELDKAIERGRQGVKVFQGWAVVITPSAKKDLGKSNFSDLKEIAIQAGAKSVTGTMPKKSPGPLSSTLFVGTSNDLTLPESQSWRYYTKDIISLSVLRGNFEENDEFLIHNEPNVNKKRKP